MNQEPTSEAEPVAEPEALEVGGTADLQWSPQQPMDLSMLDEKWKDVREDRMEEPVGWATDEADAREQYEERLAQLDPTQRQGYSFEAFTAQKNREQRDADEGAERQARTDWAQDRQDLRGEKNYWQMKESMPDEARAAFDSLDETSQQQMYSEWYKGQRAAGMNPGNFDQNVKLNHLAHDDDAGMQAILQGRQAFNQEAEGKRLEQREIGKARTAQFKEDQANAKDHYNNQQGLRRLFPNMPYAQGIQMARMLDTALSPDASLEQKQDAYNFLSQRGVMPQTDMFGGGGGGNQEPPVTKAEIEAAAKREEQQSMGVDANGILMEADEKEREIYNTPGMSIGDRWEAIVKHLASKGVTYSKDGEFASHQIADKHMLEMVEDQMVESIIDPNGFDFTDPDSTGRESLLWIQQTFNRSENAPALWLMFRQGIEQKLSDPSLGLSEDEVQDRIKALKAQIQRVTAVKVASNDLGLGEAPVIA